MSSEGSPSLKWVVGLMAAQCALALLMRNFRPLATVHAILTLVLGLCLALRHGRTLAVAQWVGYVVGAEVLWRMCKATIPWEFAKHSITLVCAVSLFRSPHSRLSWLPVVYLALLLPASFLTFAYLPFEPARKEVSFTLSGPICLALCTLRLSSLRITPAGFYRIGIPFLIPIFGVGFLVLYKMLSSDVQFMTGSNIVTSGGFGPNQVSAVLSLGALLALFLFLAEKRSFSLRLLYAATGIWLLGQAALTFSRTGIYLATTAFGMAALFLVRWKGRARRLFLLLFAIGSAASLIFPLLDAFTGGRLTERFGDRGLTGRESVAAADIKIFRAHPLLGAGAGMSTHYRAAVGDEHAAHTEYTRLLADHGILGVIALGVLAVMTLVAFSRARGPWAKAIVSALTVWAFLFMAVTAMRLAAPAALLGLIQAHFRTQEWVRRRAWKRLRAPDPGPNGRGVGASPWGPQDFSRPGLET